MQQRTSPPGVGHDDAARRDGPRVALVPEVRRALRLSVLEGALWAVMIGVSESYLGALAVELGHRDTALAMLVTVPLLAGAIAQLATPSLATWLGGRKRLVVLGAGLQALCQLGFVAIAYDRIGSFELLLVTKSLFWIFGSVIAPAWSAWMATLTQGVERGRYFAKRSAVVYFVLVIAYVGAGFFLELGRQAQLLFFSFAVLFGLALLVRFVSAGVLALQLDVAETHTRRRKGAWFETRMALRRSRWRIPVVMAAIWFGAHIAIPFFTPYMLRVLQLDYRHYALLTAVSVLTKSVAFPLWHRLGERIGLSRVFGTAGIGVALIPLLWAWVTEVRWLYLVEAMGGIAWAGVEFASFQLLLQSAVARHRVQYLSLANALSGLAQLAGSLLGSLILVRYAVSYAAIFKWSAVARAVPLLLLATPVGRMVVRGPLPRLKMRIVSLRSVGGVERRPIVTDEKEEPR